MLRNFSQRLQHTSRVASHPVISCKPLFDNSCSEDVKRGFADEVHKALKTTGYFYAADIESLSPSYIKDNYSFLKEMHSLSLDEKMKFVKPHGTYSGLDCGEEYAELDYEKGTTSSVRSWDFTMKHSYENYGLNYPTKEEQNISHDFSNFMVKSYQKQNIFGELFLQLLEKIFSLPKHTFTSNYYNHTSNKFVDEDLGTVRYLYYPGSDQKAVSNLGISAHTDFEMFTLMHQDNDGLQFLLPTSSGSSFSQEWTHAPVSEHFVVTVGDCLERYTNGYLKATPHRVIKTGQERRSIIRFHALQPKAEIYPLVQHNPALFGSKPLYSATTTWEHMDTTLQNLNKGLGAWDTVTHSSKTASYKY